MAKKKIKDPSNPGLVVSIEAEIDEEGQRVLKGYLPSTWVCNEFKNDFGKDYFVELSCRETRQLTGTKFFIQLKSNKHATIIKGGQFVTISFETDHLVYYCDKVPLPVFVVVADTTKRQAWWLYVQEYMRSIEGWRQRKSTTLRIPIQNFLGEIEAFKVAVEKACLDMKVRAASPQARLRQIAEDLQKKDDRFDILPSATLDHTLMRFRPKVPVRIRIRVRKSGPDAQSELLQLFGQGKPVHFAPGEIEFSGTPIIEDLGANGGVLTIRETFEAIASLLCIDPTGNVKARIDGLRGKYEGGKIEKSFSTELEGAPFKLSIGPIGGGTPGKIHFNHNLTRWDNQSLRALSFFRQIFTFLSAVSDGDSLVIEGEVQGNPAFRAQMILKPESVFPQAHAMFRSIDNARFVADRFSLNPDFNAEDFFGGPTWSSANALADLLRCGRTVIEDWNGEFAVQSPTIPEDEFRSKRGALEDATIVVEDGWTLPFMGAEVSIGPCVIDLDRSECHPGNPEGRELIYRGTGESRAAIRLMNQDRTGGSQ